MFIRNIWQHLRFQFPERTSVSALLRDSYRTTRPPPGLPPGSERPNAAAGGRSRMPGRGGTAGSCRTSRRTHTRGSARNTGERRSQHCCDQQGATLRNLNTGYVTRGSVPSASVGFGASAKVNQAENGRVEHGKNLLSNRSSDRLNLIYTGNHEIVRLL